MHAKGLTKKKVLAELKRIHEQDQQYDNGKILCSMCTKPHPMAEKAYQLFLSSNLGDPRIFPGSAQLEKFVDEAHKLGLEAALAGSLRKQDLTMVYGLGADVAGLRGAACTNSDRVSGQITRKLVQELVETVKQAENQANTKRA